MTLLTEVMDRPLDPSYAAAAERRLAAGSPGRRSWNTPGVFVAALSAGLLMAASAVTYGAPAPGRIQTRTQLIERIGERERVVSDRTAQVGALRADIEALRSANPTGTPPAPAELPDLEILGGALAVSGPGCVVTLDDAPSVRDAPAARPREATTDDPGRILARDVANVTNALWAAGADGIAINGNRLTATSSIRFAGHAVLVGFRPLARPYVIEAIAGPASVAAFEAGPGGAYLAELRGAYSATATLRRVGSVELPAAGSLTLRYATPAPATPADTTPGSSPPPSPTPPGGPRRGFSPAPTATPQEGPP